MRKLILWYINLNWLIMLIFMISTIAFGVNSIPAYFRLILTGCLAIYTLLTIFVLTRFTTTFTKRWFQTEEQLNEEIAKQKEHWNKADKLVWILGKTEAIRLWEEQKKLEEEAKEIEKTIPNGKEKA